MKKNLISVVFVVLACFFNVNAKSIVPHFTSIHTEEEFDVIYFISEKMPESELPPEENQEEVSVDACRKVVFDGHEGEIRYSLFRETEPNSNMEIAMYQSLIFMNLIGNGRSSRPTDFKDSDVKKEFNGDSGRCYFIADATSKYSEGYKYMNVEMFYKKGQGICLRVALFNDVEFMGFKNGEQDFTSDYIKYYHNFRFMDRDENGNYINEFKAK